MEEVTSCSERRLDLRWRKKQGAEEYIRTRDGKCNRILRKIYVPDTGKSNKVLRTTFVTDNGKVTVC
jgi:hypothetical protein